ncbi:UNVERIFIED_CONTAM: S-layer family protein [Acetivibrio alkalicellulosi]
MKKNKIIPFILVTLIIVTVISSSIMSVSASNIFKVEIADVQGKQGDTVEVPIRFINVPEEGINSCDFTIGYDENVLELIQVKPGSIIKNPNSNFSYNSPKPGRTVFMFTDETGHGREIINSDGEFARVTFKIKTSSKEQSSAIIPDKWTFANYSLKSFSTEFARGSVRVSSVASNPDTPGGSGDSSENQSDNKDSDQKDNEDTTDVINQPDVQVPGSQGQNNAYLRGYPDGNFKPENNITRAEAAVIFANLLEVDRNNINISKNISYTDLKEDHWAVWAVKYVSDIGLFSGYPDGSFKPNNSITRAEFSTVVFKFLELEDYGQKTDKFKDTVGHWAQQFIERLSELGYVNGYPDGTFKPQASIKRAESVALINRALKRGPLYGTEQIFPDVPKSYWAFGDIAKGVLNHTFTVDEEGREFLLEILNNN